MKTIGTILLSLSMLLVFSGCGSNQSSQSSSANSSGTSSTNSKVVTITESDYFTNQQPNDALNNLIKEFESTHPNIKINRTNVPYEQFLPTTLRQAKTKSLPTILLVDNLNIPAMVEAGALTPFDQFGSVDKSEYLPGPISTVTYKNKLYGLPFGSNDLAIFYNKDLLKKAGVTPPKTWDELLKAAKKLHSGQTYGIAFSAPSDEQATWQFSPFLWENGGDLTNLNSSGGVGALKLWQTLVKEGGASPSVVNFSQTQAYNEFAAGRAAMMEMGPWMIPSLKDTKINYGVVPLPTPKEGQQAISPIGGEDWTITTSATKAQQKAAWTFVKWVQDKKRLPKLDETFGYIPAYKPAFDEFNKEYPQFKVFSEELKNARALTEKTGSHFPDVSQDIANAIQQVLTSQQTPAEAAKSTQAKIDQSMGK